MFDLEQSITTWRGQLSAAGIRNAETLDELEAHLRDDISHTRAGLTPQEAFDAAALRLGQAAVLQKEFKKVSPFRRAAASAKRAVLAFAGVPNHYINAPDSDRSSNLESRWVTYLRCAAFLAPGIWVWVLAAIYVVPQSQSLFNAARLTNVETLVFLYRFIIGITELCRDNLIYIFGLVAILLGLLEWRSRAWPRYRRAVFGATAFLLNVAILFSLFVMFIAATVTTVALVQPAK